MVPMVSANRAGVEIIDFSSHWTQWRETADAEERQPCTGWAELTHLKLSSQSIPNIFKMHSHHVLPWLYPDLVMRKVHEKINKIGLWTRNSFFLTREEVGRTWFTLLHALPAEQGRSPIKENCWFLPSSLCSWGSIHWWPKAGGAEGDPLGRKCFDV